MAGIKISCLTKPNRLQTYLTLRKGDYTTTTGNINLLCGVVAMCMPAGTNVQLFIQKYK